MAKPHWKSNIDRAVGDAVEDASSAEVALVLAHWLTILLKGLKEPDQ